VLAAIALAVPTLNDIVGASNILDRHDTFYVSLCRSESCEWIRTHLPTAPLFRAGLTMSGLSSDSDRRRFGPECH